MDADVQSQVGSIRTLRTKSEDRSSWPRGTGGARRSPRQRRAGATSRSASCRAGADPQRREAARQRSHSGRSVCPASTANAVARAHGKTRGAISQPVRQPGSLPGRNAGAGAQRGRVGRAGQVSRRRSTSPRRRLVRRRMAGQAARGPCMAPSPPSTTGSCGRSGSAPYPTACERRGLAAQHERNTCSGCGAWSGYSPRRSNHFGRALRAARRSRSRRAVASLIEGLWLNQCLIKAPPLRPAEPIATLLLRSAACLWRGRVAPLSSHRISTPTLYSWRKPLRP